jgi:hypothetical protein
MSLGFEVNAGQWPPEVRYLARAPGYALFLTPKEAVLSLSRVQRNREDETASAPSTRADRGASVSTASERPDLAVIRMKLVGANLGPPVKGLEPLPGKVNYLRGSDPATWRTNVATYAKVKYEQVYPGIDLVFYGSHQEQLEYDFVVAPGTDPKSIRLEFTGADKIEVEASGDLVLHNADEEIRLRKPMVYQMVGGVRNQIAASYAEPSITDHHSTLITFDVASYDPSRSLIIDPVLSFSSHLGGGSGYDLAQGIAVDPARFIYVAGTTGSPEFGLTNALDSAMSGLEAFVIKLRPGGTGFVYATYVGGFNHDGAWAAAADAAGNVYLTGDTSPPTGPLEEAFPLVNAFQSTFDHSQGWPMNAFVTKLSPNGDQILYSTLFGGANQTQGKGIAVDSAGRATIVGWTQSDNLPVRNAAQPVYAGGAADSFVARFDTTQSGDASLLGCTYLGGSEADGALAVALNALGQACVIGSTASTNFPITNAFQSAYGGGEADAFVATLSEGGDALLYSTFIGGSGADIGLAHNGAFAGIAVDATGAAYVAANTRSTNFPVAKPVQAKPAGFGPDAFVAKLAPSGSALLYSTYWGSELGSQAHAIAVDAAGYAHVTGVTSGRFPVVNAFQPALGTTDNLFVSDAFVLKLNPDGDEVISSSYLGGPNHDAGFGVAVDATGNTYVCGTAGAGFPTVNPLLAPDPGGSIDAFVARISEPADTEPPRIGVARNYGDAGVVEVAFSEPVTEATATNVSNYSFDNRLAILSAAMADSSKVVRLTTSALAAGTDYTLTVNNVQDRALPTHNTIAPNSQALVLRTQGSIELREYHEISGSLLSDLESSFKFPDQPDRVAWLRSLEVPTNARDQYGVVLRGFLTPPVSGDYVFYLSSEDQGALYLSPDDNPATRQRIATEPEWNPPRSWTRTDRRPNRENVSAPVNLIAGRFYYLEARMKDAAGNDSLGVAWKVPGGGAPVDGSSPIPGLFLSATKVVGPMVITQPPQAALVGEGQDATFSVAVDGTPPYTYQWFRNGAAIPGKIRSTYTLSNAVLADSGALFTVQVSNAFSSVTSAEAALTVATDITPPTIESVTGGIARVTVRFSEPVTSASATDASHYSINGGVAVSAAALLADQRTVVLTTSRQGDGADYLLTVSGVRDASITGNPIIPNTAAPFRSLLLTRGFLRREVYLNIPGASLAELTSHPRFPTQPDAAGFVESFETPSDAADSYGVRLSGWLLPQNTGDYVFYLSADEAGALFLSTDETWFRKVQIASESQPHGPRDWTGTERRTNRENVSAPIRLEAGQAYYVEALMKDGSGPDNLGVAWRQPGDPEPGAGDAPIAAVYLAAVKDTEPLTMAITTQPASQTVNEFAPVSFRVELAGSPPYAIQWFRDGTAIPGATGTIFPLPEASLSDNGAVFSVTASNGFSEVTSGGAGLTVNADVTPPLLLGATGSATLNEVTLAFSERINPADAADASHFALSGGLTVLTATLGADGRSVVLRTSPQTPGAAYVVTVTGVRDLAAAANVIAPGSQAGFTAFQITRGFLRQEFFANIAGTALADLTSHAKFPAQPDAVTHRPGFETVTAIGANYGVRLSGFLRPPVTGDYVFYLCSDDEGALFLSSDENPANKVQIASEPASNPYRHWLTGPKQGSRGSPPSNVSDPIRLEAGRRYYVEALMKQGGGNDYLGVAWQPPGEPPPPNFSPPIAGEFLEALADPRGTSLTFVEQPASASVVDHETATFSVKVEVSLRERFYQWQRDGVDIRGANDSRYTTPPLAVSDNGARYRCLVTIPGASATSDAAVLTVNSDSTPPHLVSASGNVGLNQVMVTFSEPIDPADATVLANFALNGGLTVMGAMPQADNRAVTLTTSPQTPGQSYTLTVNGVRDTSAAANPIAANSQIAFLAWENEEFVGPFPSWADVKRDYGAVGDGIADDTPALQAALDGLGRAGQPFVLWIPAGTYRITQELLVNQIQGIGIYGEHSDTTILRWDGPDGGIMFHNRGVPYSRMGRLTFDGAGRAGVAIDYSRDIFNSFQGTANEFADLVIQDCAIGMRGGHGSFAGDDGAAILRCHFLRCWNMGISMESYNAVNWWVWHSTFENCRIGAGSVLNAGMVNVYESTFLRSTEADYAMGNCTSYLALRGNTSVESKAFFIAGFNACPGQITLQGNTVIDPWDDAPIRIGNVGPLLLFDNVFRNRAGASGPVIRMNLGGDVLSVGNTYTVSDPIETSGRVIALDDRLAGRTTLKPELPVWPGTLPIRSRPVFEVAAGATATDIQQAIAQADGLRGQRPVVHLPPAIYEIDRTLVIPAGSDVQFVGDSFREGTHLRWTGSGSGPVLRLAGPSHATLRDFSIHGGRPAAQNAADGIVVEDCDQPGARVFMDQCSWSPFSKVGLLVDRLDHADVTLQGSGIGLGDPLALRVIGGPARAAGEAVEGRVAYFGSQGGGSQMVLEVLNHGHLLIQDFWAESDTLDVRASDSGTVTLNNMYFQPRYVLGTPSVLVDDFDGQFTLLNGYFTQMPDSPSIGRRLQVAGRGVNTEFLYVGGWANSDHYFLNTSPNAEVGFLLSHKPIAVGDTNAEPLADQGTSDPGFLRRMLAQLRSETPRPLVPLPAGVTDVRMVRIDVSYANIGVKLSRANEPVLPVPAPPQIVDEHQTLRLANLFSDADLPFNTLTFALRPGAPVGAVVDPATGGFAWRPHEGHGPGIYEISVVATDDGSPPSSATNLLHITVNEVNIPPRLGLLQQVTDGQLPNTAEVGPVSDHSPPGSTTVLGNGTIEVISSPGQIWGLADRFHFPHLEVSGDFDARVRVTSLEPTQNWPHAGLMARGSLAADSQYVAAIVTPSEPVAPGGQPQNSYEGHYRELGGGGEGWWPGFNGNLAYNVPYPNAWIRLTRNGQTFAAYRSTDGSTWTKLGELTPAEPFPEALLLGLATTPSRSDIPVSARAVYADFGLTRAKLVPIGGREVNEGAPLNFALSAVDVDLPAQTFNLSLAPGAPAGATIDPATGAFAWTPGEDQGMGVYPITIRVTDDGDPPLSAEQAFTVTVNEVNSAPVVTAVSDQSASEHTLFTFTPSATDADLPPNQLTWSLGPGAPAGMSIDPASGMTLWTPDESRGGASYPVTVTLTDDGVPPLSDSKTFTISVAEVNSAPQLAVISNQSVDELSELTFAATASDGDLPPQRLTFSLVPGAPQGAAISPEGVFRWTPSEAQGPCTFPVTIRVTDGGTPPLSAEQTLTVTVNEVNAAPVLAAIGSKGVDELQPLSFVVAASDPNDVPPNAFSLSADGLPVGAAFDPLTGTFSWVPSEEQQGTFIVTFTATDDGVPPLSASETITITVSEVNAAPVLAAIGDKAVDELTELTFAATASDPNDSPPNAVTLSADGLPEGASFDPATGTLAWTPTEAQGPGSYQVTFTATDDGAPPLADSETVTIAVNEVNSAPVLTAIGNKSVDESGALAFTVGAGDPNDTPANAVSLSVSGLPDGATFDPATGACSWTPTEAQGPGSFQVTFTATDDGTPPLADSETITITVHEVNAAPVLAAIGNKAVDELSELAFVVTASDPSDSPPNHVTSSASGLPDGASFDPATGRFSWRPSEAQGPGSYAVTFTATDDGTPPLSGSESITISVQEVNAPPVVTLKRPAEGATFAAPAELVIEAEASDVDGAVTTVEFFAGPAKLGEQAATPYSFTWRAVPAGRYALSARARDDQGASATSSTVKVAVLAALRAVELLPDGSFQMTLHGEPNRHYALEVSEDLATWTPLRTGTVTPDGTLPFTEVGQIGLGQRFYRARLLALP